VEYEIFKAGSRCGSWREGVRHWWQS